MSMGEILVILVVAILVLGPDKLPDTIVQIAKILKALKRNIDDAKSSIEKEIRISELKNEAKKYQDEFSAANENIRKKLSFEEFDELKKDILDNKKVDLTFGSAPNPNETSLQNTQEQVKNQENPLEEKQNPKQNEEKQNV
ncbi:MAG: Sec-independent protein translocase subunit TatB [Campylobacter sp.]|nr:Sec-independent protein translocase subunit TatB [Campylobacter sp.]